VRTEACPICAGPTNAVVRLDLGAKPPLPATLPIQACEVCDFAFVAAGDARDYDAYYAAVANDECHREVEGADSPSAQQAALLRRQLGRLPARVLDFGCGSGDLLAELAAANPDSHFVGWDVSAPALGTARQRLANLANAAIVPFEALASEGPFDLVILSHVLEHLLEFSLLATLRDLLADDGVIYIEVPDALRYEHRPRLEYLYYFDRLHVNHFTPQALASLGAKFGFGFTGQVERDFRYRDGQPYPAVGVFFRKDEPMAAVDSPDLGASLGRYLAGERHRFADVTRELSQLPGVLVWGAGDNFHRAASAGGPLSGLAKMRLLDRRTFRVRVGGADYETEPPEQTIRACPWPLVITVSEHRSAIQRQVVAIDPLRPIHFL
jgi:2-polyprenyl-3-methyl-5-hydroxy-6-metoxy-1,4-benzoquinol methylase